MRIEKNYNLKSHNTFGIEAHCSAFATVKNEQDLETVLAQNTLPVYVLGSGSNMLFTQPKYDVLFIKNEIKGIKKVQNIEASSNAEKSTFSKYQIIEIGSGVGWHELVLWCLNHNLGGIENLSLIPGTVGAAPIQNIGAYGVELKDIFVKLDAINLQTLKNKTFRYNDCLFGYRDSVFKNELRGTFFIIKVYLKLTQKAHKIKTNYGDIKSVLTEKNISNPTIQEVSDAVIQIRQSKLPDPSVIGNAGSFFKNPEISKLKFEALKNTFPNIVGYPTENGVKVAAGWLIEQCGWKGKRMGGIGVHEQQALVLVNYGNGKGLEIKQLAENIQYSILEKFGIELSTEVNIL
jgi:UDP-N-acetylmuramate dehydrogenase